jgi:site-specific DNA recombinase
MGLGTKPPRIDPIVIGCRCVGPGRLLEPSPPWARAHGQGYLRLLRRRVLAVGRNYLACTTARRQGMCENRQSIQRQSLESLVLDALKSELMAPEHVAAFAEEFITEWNRQLRSLNADRGAQQRELGEVQRKLDNLTDAIANGMRASGKLQQKLDDLEARQLELERLLARPQNNAPRLHPNLSEVYRHRVADLQAALSGLDATEAIEQVRALIERVVLRPASDGRGFQVELEGAITEMTRIGAADVHRASVTDRDLFDRSVKVVAGIGFEPMTFRL